MLSYLLKKTLKNNIRVFVRTPSKLILGVFMAALLALLLFMSGETPAATAASMDMFYALIFVVYLVLYALSAFKGLDSGATFYKMPDVSILFTSPIPSQRILMYGLLKQMTTSSLVGLLLVFQYGWLNGLFGITFGDLLIAIAGYVVVMVLGQLTAMVIYSWSSADEKRQKRARNGIFILVGVVAAYALYMVYATGLPTLDALVAAANTPVIKLVPIAGWAMAAIVGIFTGDGLLIALGFAACAVFGGLLFAWLRKGGTGYYEDVLAATESAFKAASDAKEGTIQEVAAEKIKVDAKGMARGHGASVFFYKHMTESKRVKGFILDTNSLIFMAVTVLFGFLYREDGGLLPAYAFSIYMLIFTMGTGRWAKELTRPYVYMTPEPPFKKLIWVCAESVVRCLVESALTFVLLGFVLGITGGGVFGIDGVTLIMCILSRVGFGLVFMATNIMEDRLFGTVSSKGLMMFIYIIMALILCVPAIVAGVAATFVFTADFAFMAATLPVNIGVALLVAALCRKVLQCAELNQNLFK